ncbi:MAG: hypothetical protein ACI4P8_07585 [Akkermansia sp.]
MKATFLLPLAGAAALLSSCVYYTPAVTDMPYHPGTASRSTYPDTWVTQAPATHLQAALPPGTAVGAPATRALQPAAIPTPTPALPPSPVAAKAPSVPAAAAKPLDLTKTATPAPAPKPVAAAPKPPTPAATAPVATPKPPVSAAPAPVSVAQAPKTPAPSTPAPKAAGAPAAPAAAYAAGTDLKSITNQGPIPVATRVEGDPTRVYNPLDPSKTIRVTDKNGQPYPSGKELKVRGTNFHFRVP